MQEWNENHPDWADAQKRRENVDENVIDNVMRHRYKVLSDAEKLQMRQIKDCGLDFHKLVDSFGGSRELSLAKTRIEEAVMWAVKHITGGGI